MEENIENIDEIRRLKKKLAEVQAKIPEPPKEEVPKEEPMKKDYVAPSPVYANEEKGDFPTFTEEKLKQADRKSEELNKKGFVPPDPLAHITGMEIKWIDNRYQIHGVPGIPGGNIITLRSMGAIEQLINDLKYTKEHFDQKEMISTKKPKILPKKTCVYLNEKGKCINEHYFDGIIKEYTIKSRKCLFADQDRCPQAD